MGFRLAVCVQICQLQYRSTAWHAAYIPERTGKGYHGASKRKPAERDQLINGGEITRARLHTVTVLYISGSLTRTVNLVRVPLFYERAKGPGGLPLLHMAHLRGSTSMWEKLGLNFNRGDPGDQWVISGPWQGCTAGPPIIPPRTSLGVGKACGSSRSTLEPGSHCCENDHHKALAVGGS